MRISNRILGPLLAPIFIQGGLDCVRRPESKVKVADVVTGPLSSRFDVIPDDPVTLVRLHGSVQVVGGSLLAAGRVPRLAALVLAGTLVPSTYAGHRFWVEVDDEDRARQLLQFLKNTAIFGGLLAVAFSPSHRRRGGAALGRGRHTSKS